jgi:hypothetical protein
MTVMPNHVLADPSQIIAELQRRLDERTAERDALGRRRFGLGASILRRSFLRKNQIRARVFFEVVRPLRSWSGRGFSSPVWSKLLKRGVSAAGIPGGEDLTAKRSRREMARRNHLKRLNPRREMVWSRKPGSHNI